jgi:hypothetical protein
VGAVRTLARWGGLGAALALATGLWLLWTSAVPYGEAPDEPSHVEVARFVAAHGRLPVFGPEADAYTRLDQVGIPIEPHALAPPLPYLVGAGLVWLFALPAEGAMRVAALLGALAAVAGTHALVRRLLPSAPGLAAPAAALLAAVPQVSFQAAVANSDIYALAGAAAVGATWSLVGRWCGALVFGGAVGLALLTKLTAYPAVAVAVAAAWERCRQLPAPCPCCSSGERGWPAGPRPSAAILGSRGWSRGALARLTLVLLVAGAVAGPWFARNLLLYGEPLPLRTGAAAFAALAPPVPIPGATAPPLLSAAYLHALATITAPSFWAGFGRVDLFAPWWCYAAIAGLCAGGALGLVRLAREPGGWAALGASRLTAGVLLGWTVACLLAAVAAGSGRYFPPHGRYLLPLLPPLVVALALGWRALLPAARWVPWALVAAMVAFNLYCLFGVVLPHYYGPGSTRLTVTVDAPRPGEVVTMGTTVRGWAVVSGRERWVPGAIGGPPAWHALPERVWAVQMESGRPLAGGAGVARPDVARALGTPEVAAAGFEFRWMDDAAAAGEEARGRVTHLTVCADDRRATGPHCVTLPLRLP